MRLGKASVTLRDVAVRAGVSVATVSYVLNNSRGVGPDVKRRVTAAAESLGYRANVLAQGLKAGSARLVACIVSNLSNPLIAAAVEAASQYLAQRGYGMLVFRAGPTSANLSEAVSLTASYRAAGLLVVHPLAGQSKELRQWVRDGKPLTLAIHPHHSLKADQVLMAGEEAAQQATTYLIEKGHRSIALLARSLDLEIYADVARGYVGALAQAGIVARKEWLRSKERPGDTAPEAGLGYREMRNLLQLRHRPTAVVCAHNKISIGALQALRDANLTIPDDMSLLSFDRMDWMTITHPSISSIGVDGTSIGSLAAEVILERIADGNLPTTTLRLPLELSPGASVASVEL